jgi:uncharacterized protein (UPF0147 family)
MVTTKVNIENTESFKNALSILSEILRDKRISEDIRGEYIHKSSELLSPKNNNVMVVNKSWK